MAKLTFRYSAMNAGKSTMAMQIAHNYEEIGASILVIKPLIDTKGEDTITSRIGINRKVDYLLSDTDSPLSLIKKSLKEKAIDAIIVDEAQFLTENQVNEFYYITKMLDIAVLCFGLRCDFQMQGFVGAPRLLLLADDIEEIKTLCSCKKKATQNLRLVNGEPTFEGDQVAIDGKENITYKSVCGECFIKYYMEWKEKKRKKKKIHYQEKGKKYERKNFRYT